MRVVGRAANRRRRGRENWRRSAPAAGERRVAGQARTAATVVNHPWRVVDFGCGEGYYARAVRDAAMVRDDLALELAAFGVPPRRGPDLAARRWVEPARVAVADATRDVPLIDDSVDAVISVFAPRSPSELARVVRAGGRVCREAWRGSHARAEELSGDGVTVLGVEPGKSDRVDASMLSNGFEIVHRREIHGTLTLSEEDVFDLLYMGRRAPQRRNGDSRRGERRAARRDEIVRGGGISAVSRRMNR